MALRGIDYLRKKLEAVRPRVNLRYQQYAMQHRDEMVGLVIPPHIRMQYQSVIGWCAKGVDCLADRLVFRGFDFDTFNVNLIFDRNNPDILYDNIVLSALIASCCFVYLYNDPDKGVQMQVIEASNATGVIDPITGLLKEGYAVLERDDYDKPILEAYFTPEKTIYYQAGKTWATDNPTGNPLLVPVIHRPDAVRPFGRSRITRSGMYYQQLAKRTLERADITAEFYSFPQKYILGLSPDAEAMDSWKATVSSMLQFTRDDEGRSPTVGQFTTSSMSPFTEQLKTAAAGFAGEMGLTLDDLGFVSENPSSVEAIKASHENLRLAGRKAQRSLGTGLLNVAYLAVCLQDEFEYYRSRFVMTEPKWKPLFEADASTLALIGDGLLKINQALPEYMGESTFYDLTGIKGGKIKR